ncbi:MAG: ferritin [Acidimicrobiia bacterium]
MKMTPVLADAFNRQITLELESSLAYLQMAAYFDTRSLKGMSSWMRVQSEEERAHALKFFDYVLSRGNDVSLGSNEAPAADFDSPAGVFELALAQERKVSASISELYRTASAETDAASFPLLQWFLQEQVEEEATVSAILDQLQLIGSDGGALLMLDRDLAGRSPEAASAE